MQKISIASCDVFLPIQALLRNRKRFSFIIVYNMTKLSVFYAQFFLLPYGAL